jgi:hypothetical protein
VLIDTIANMIENMVLMVMVRREEMAIVWLMGFVSVVICTIISPSTCRFAVKVGVVVWLLNFLGTYNQPGQVKTLPTKTNQNIKNQGTSWFQFMRAIRVGANLRLLSATPCKSYFFCTHPWFFLCPILTTGVSGPCQWLDNVH